MNSLLFLVFAEDVTDIILNLKQLCIKVEEDVQLPLEVHFDFQKDGVLTAADLAEQFHQKWKY